MKNLYENMYDLIPANGRKSFYGKARVSVNKDGSKVLYSYGYPIAKMEKDKIYRLCDEDAMSMTTCTHVLSFCGLHKKEFLKLEKVN